MENLVQPYSAHLSQLNYGQIVGFRVQIRKSDSQNDETCKNNIHNHDSIMYNPECGSNKCSENISRHLYFNGKKIPARNLKKHALFILCCPFQPTINPRTVS
jgi:hypothetical protein